MKIKAVLFDLDGTLRDTREVIYNSLKHAIRQVGGAVPSDQDLHDHIHHHTKVHQQFAAHVSTEEFELAYFAKLFEGLPGVTLYEKASDLLQDLHSRGTKVAIVSSAAPDEIATFLEQVGIRKYVDVVLGDDGTMARKPSPGPVLAAVSRLQIEPEDCAMVGDMHVDMQAALAAQVPIRIGVTHGFESAEQLRAAGATHIIDSLEPLPQLLDSIE